MVCALQKNEQTRDAGHRTAQRMAGPRSAGRLEKSTGRTPRTAKTLGGHYADGPLGLDPLDRHVEKSRYTEETHRRRSLQNERRRKTAMLLQPQHVYGTDCVEDGSAAGARIEISKKTATVQCTVANLRHTETKLFVDVGTKDVPN